MLPSEQALRQETADAAAGRAAGICHAAHRPQPAAAEPRLFRRRFAVSAEDMTHSRPDGGLHRHTIAELDLGALTRNLSSVRTLCPRSRALAVVKANAYGHGAVPVARALASAGVDLFGVALVEEGLELRDAGLSGEILVLDGAYGDLDEVVARDLVPVVFLPEHLIRLSEAAARAGRRVRAHLKLDTGMARIGVPPEDLPDFLAAASEAKGVVIDGLLSHFANADLQDQELTRVQIDRFREAAALIRSHGHPIGLRHLSNSAGVMDLSPLWDGLELNAVRPGIMLYGEVPAARLRGVCPLEPVLTFRTRVVQVKRVAAGSPVSYGGRWVAPRESLIATLPVGYADGYARALSNVGEVLVRGKRARVAGAVCMDMMMVDVTEVPGVRVDDDVVLLGAQGGDRITAQELADHCRTIHYEILCAIGARVPRVVRGPSLAVDEGTPDRTAPR